MRIKVTEEGVLIPKQLLEGVDEVDVRQEENAILVVPLTADDPIFELGTDPITIDVDDASVNHDRYLYQL